MATDKNSSSRAFPASKVVPSLPGRSPVSGPFSERDSSSSLRSGLKCQHSESFSYRQSLWWPFVFSHGLQDNLLRLHFALAGHRIFRDDLKLADQTQIIRITRLAPRAALDLALKAIILLMDFASPEFHQVAMT